VPISVHHARYQALQAEMAAIRQAAGLTQVELAKALGVGQSYVSKVERGEMYLDVMVFIDWCIACHAPSEKVIAKIVKF
jgi:transcriptional regulator with XRE-family HTH domain